MSGMNEPRKQFSEAAVDEPEPTEIAIPKLLDRYGEDACREFIGIFTTFLEQHIQYWEVDAMKEAVSAAIEDRTIDPIIKCRASGDCAASILRDFISCLPEELKDREKE